jgi:hypothetical protein
VPWKKVAAGLVRVDPGCVLHGVWFNEASFAGGKVRLTRALSGYIEAEDPSTANFGFQKRDGVSDRTDKESGQSAVEGYGSVIGPKQHFTSPSVKAYFQIDLERLRSYGLTTQQVHALAAWAIYKIRRVLVASRDGVADLRTECKFEVARRMRNGERARVPDETGGGNEEAIECWLVQQDTGDRKPYLLPRIDEDLKSAFASLKFKEEGSDGKYRGPLTVRWVPNVEGKAELPDALNDDALNRQGLEGKSKIEAAKPKKGAKSQEQKKPKRLLIVYGEWSAADKQRLREQNSGDPARTVVERAIKDYEAKWEAKAQSRKPESEKEEEGEGGNE